MARRKKTRKKKTPYIITEYIVNDEEKRGKVEILPNSHIKVGDHDNPLRATATVRASYRYFQDGDTIVKVPEKKWQELITKMITIEDIWGD